MAMDPTSMAQSMASMGMNREVMRPEQLENMEADKAGEEFESFMAQMLMKEMRRSMPEGGLFKGPAAEMFAGMFDQEIAKKIAENGDLGIGKIIAAKMRAQEGLDPEAAAPMANAKGALPAELSTFRMPVPGARMTSRFGMRSDPFSGHSRDHKGIDLAAPQGAAIRPVADGTVVLAGKRSGYGNVVVVDHGDGLRTLYAHCHELKVRAGDQVDGRSVLGTVGSTGRSTGSHLHFEVRRDGEQVDPESAMGWPK
jgi:murein DD-endopeptidase MepM/ murein hydrolase activator NlpD